MRRFLIALLPSLIASAAYADDYRVTIKDHRFSPTDLALPANERVKLYVRNDDAAPEEFESRELDIEKVIPANSEGYVYIRPLAPGTYHYFGDFHQDTAQGTLTAK